MMTSRAGGDEASRASYVKAYDAAKAAGDREAMAAAALRLAGLQMFGLLPGRIPAFLHEAYTHAEGRLRVELAVAIARAWGYGYQPKRAREFAAEAVNSAEAAADPTLMAAALDAQLIASWGPDDLATRLEITSRLEDTTAHISDVDVQMTAHLWRLTTALECLDVPTMRRQLRGLDRLATESGSPRVQFFAAARRAMHALLIGDNDEAERARRAAVAAGYEANEPDAYAIEHALAGAIARQSGDVARMLAEAPAYEDFGLREGVASIAAEGAQLWTQAGELDRARRILHQLAGADFSQVRRDVDWLLTVTVLTEVAAAVGDRDLAAHAIELLVPYAGRGVSNGGAVTFGGVVDHYLALAAATIGDHEAASRWFGSALQAYERVGATWWANRCRAAPAAALGTHDLVLRPAAAGTWQVGGSRQSGSIREMKGLRYLRLLLAHPGRDISAIELSALATGNPNSPLTDSALPVVDEQALAAYRSRLAAIDDELDAADRSDDADLSRRLTSERAALVTELRSVTGLAGRTRSTGGSDERARIAVRKAITAAIGKIVEIDPSLARLLHDTITTGSVCRYEPDPDRPATWLLS
jgi:tetratricopeptide (TPR) repeat protein